MKFAQIGYGHDGRGGQEKGGYTYLVNDNVREGDRLQVAAHSPAGRLFGTTGKTLIVAKNLQKVVKQQNKEMVQASTERLQEKGMLTESGTPERDKLLSAESARDLGVGQKGFKKAPEYGTVTQRDIVARGAAIERAQQRERQTTGTVSPISQTRTTQRSVETFEEYSRKFMPKGD